MFKINSYFLFFLGFLFVNNPNVHCFSFSQTNDSSLPPTQSQQSLFPSTYQCPESCVSTCSLFPISRSITPQPYNSHSNSSTNPPFILPDWDPNNATNTFTGISNTHLLMTHERENFNDTSTHTNNNPTSSVSSHTQQQKVTNEANAPIATTPSQKSLFPNIFQQAGNNDSTASLLPIESSVTPQPYNRYFNSSTNTFDACSLEDLRYLQSAASFSNDMTSANTNNIPIPSVLPHTNQDRNHAHAETKKKKQHTKTYTCPRCNKTLANQSSFKYHLRTHDSNRTRLWQCSICDKSFAEKSILKIHINRHNKEKSFKCEFCSKTFKTKSEKTMHHRTHTGEKPYQCTFCGKCFAAQSTLHSHVRTHTGEKPFKCDICGKGLSSKGSLKDHLNKHRGKKPYSCKECEKSFRSKRRLNEHRKLHQNPKPYKCTQCTKAYTTREGLKYHIKAHNKPKAYTCHYCNAAFALKSEYKNHILYEEEPDDDRKCHICKTVYSNKTNLKRHNKRAHTET